MQLRIRRDTCEPRRSKGKGMKSRLELARFSTYESLVAMPSRLAGLQQKLSSL